MIQTPVEYEVGDIVQVKDWDEMVLEFGLATNEVINTPKLTFLRAMEHLCGQVFEISAKKRESGAICYRSAENIEDRSDSCTGLHWYLTAYMLKPFDDSGSEFETDLGSWAALIGG